MKTSAFLQILEENKDKPLVFEYFPGLLIGANYHITEVKHVKIDSVDCGSGTDNWNETIIQLWESPKEKGKREYLSVDKAFSILKKVDGIKPFDPDAEIKFEYGNSNFHTAQLFVNSIETEEDNLLIKLAVNATDCKAKELCGVPAQKMETASACCTPESGCC